MTRIKALINYTTKSSVEKTVGEIQQMLVASKARAVLCEYDGAGNITAISFKAETQFGMLAFRLPANISAAARVLNRQADAGKIAQRFKNDVDQARRIAWRIVRQWIEAQLAFIQLEQVTLEQIMLSFAQDETGKTLYELTVEKRFVGLALPAPKEKAA